MQTTDHTARPLPELRRKLLGGDATVGGVLSGTSADGIDVALVRFESSSTDGPGRPVCSIFETIAYDENPANRLEQRVRRVLDGEPLELGQLARLNRDLGRAFGQAARSVANRHGLSLDLVASHGQTVWHHDGGFGGAATLQLGDGCEVAEVAGCTVVSDFRQRDIAAGGEGAPLLALVEEELFPREPRPLAVLNLGGISNLTWLPDAGRPILSFDAGPAGSLLDGFARRLLDQPFDAGGRVALEGSPRADLIASWGEHPFFLQAPPRSTGRDTFGESWIDDLLSGAGSGLSPADALRTAVEFVAECVARAVNDFLAPAGTAPIAVAGGGVHNRALMEALARRTGSSVESSASYGVDPDAREALAFAVLGARAVLGIPSSLPSATGAEPGRILGKLSMPPVH